MPRKHLMRHTQLTAQAKGKGVDMTQGNILRHILTFALPLLVGNLFQQMYNTVDTWVIGNYVNSEKNQYAFAAVGSLTPILNIFIGAFSGLASGAGVVISQYFGAGREEDVSKTVHTAAVLTIILGITFSFLGLAMIPFFLNLMDMPQEVRPDATTYLTIYFSGMVGLVVYNMGAGILRAIGDSKRPFYYLVVCAVLNTVLDLIFVINFGMGVEGVALATIISQCVSAVLVVITLMFTSSCVHLRVSKLRVHFSFLKKIIRVGIPASIQMAITSFANIFGQSYINQFGPEVMAGWGAYVKIDQMLFLPMQSVAMAVSTFVGQNLGKNQVDRAKKGIHISLFIALSGTLILMIPILLFTNSIVAFINPDADTVRYGTLLLQWLTPFYLLCCFNQIYASALRGAGNSKVPMVCMITSFVIFRQLYMFVMSTFICNELIPVAMGYPAGWLLCSLLTGIYYYSTRLDKTRLVEDTPTTV